VACRIGGRAWQVAANGWVQGLSEKATRPYFFGIWAFPPRGGYPTVRLTLFWNLAGVMPVMPLKSRVKESGMRTPDRGQCWRWRHQSSGFRVT